LKEEQANAEKANMFRLEAETRCHLAERERDIYLLLARRWKGRLNSQLGGERSDNDSIEEAAAAMLLGGSENVSIFSLVQRFHAHADHNDDEEDEDDEEDDDIFESQSDSAMDEDEDESFEGMIDEDGEEHEASGPPVATVASSSKLIMRHQVRTVSIAGEDEI
jgi:hypothetical protein